MFRPLLAFVLTRRPMVLLGLLAFLVAGLLAFYELNVEAYPNGNRRHEQWRQHEELEDPSAAEGSQTEHSPGRHRHQERQGGHRRGHSKAPSQGCPGASVGGEHDAPRTGAPLGWDQLWEDVPAGE